MMHIPKDTKLLWKQVDVYAPFGLCYTSCCAPKDMTVEDVEKEVNISNPTGISTLWKKSKDTHFVTGQTNPCVCEKDPNRLHYLMEC